MGDLKQTLRVCVTFKLNIIKTSTSGRFCRPVASALIVGGGDKNSWQPKKDRFENHDILNQRVMGVVLVFIYDYFDFIVNCLIFTFLKMLSKSREINSIRCKFSLIYFGNGLYILFERQRFKTGIYRHGGGAAPFWQQSISIICILWNH